MTIQTKMLAIMGLIIAGFLGTFGTSQVLSMRQSMALVYVERATSRVVTDFIPLQVAIRDVQADIIQVQRSLADTSATHHKDGFASASKYGNAFADHMRSVKEIFGRLQISLARMKLDTGDDPKALVGASALDGLDTELDALADDFPAYNALGVATAHAYIDRGMETGNAFMSGFNAAADTLNTKFDLIDKRVSSAIDLADQHSSVLIDAAGEITKNSNRIVNTLDAGGLIVCLLALWFIRAQILHPLTKMTSAMRRLADGDTAIMNVGSRRRDEIGNMATALEVFREHAIENLSHAAAEEVNRTSAETEKRAAMNGMAGTIETAIKSALTLITSRTDAMAADADAMSASASRTGTSAQGAETSAENTLMNAQAVAAATEQLTSSIQEISRQANHSTGIVHQAVSFGHRARASIEELDGKVALIGKVAEIISEIAEKTNLLALNATIEAARAGEAGRGFAVVAGEVKALARQTAQSTQEISGYLNEVTKATVESVTAVKTIEGAISEIDFIANSIAAAVEEQGAATAEISRNVTETAQAANEMKARISEVSEESGNNERQATSVNENATGLAVAVVELQRVILNAVRTSTAEVDRRREDRHAIHPIGQATLAGQGQKTVKVIDLSLHGAKLAGLPPAPSGTRGVLSIAGVAASLPFIVHELDGENVRVEFAIDDKAVANLRGLLSNLLKQAA